ncbi:MAG: 4-alpha-glucanotransferase, partial [Myxococcota bacterium]
DAYQRRHPKADEYARFRAVTEARRLVWTHWPDADSRTIGDDAFDDRMRRFHLYAQFAMDAALARTADEAGVELYLDFPVGVNRCGYDTWSERDSFVLDASAGAPPDALFSEGQNWGLAPLHPQRLREAGYRYFIDSIRSHVEHAGLLRVDHVMGLHRVYWVLEGASAKDGIYVNYQAPEFYAILCLESSRNRCEVVGEDLGTVPDYVPPAMREHRLRGLYIGQFGLGADPASDESLENIPVEAVASLNTHDTPTFAGFWHGDDIADRMDLGLIDEDQAAEERKGRATMRAETITFLREQGTLDEAAADDDVFAIMNAITQYLGASQADIVLVSLEDLWLERDPQNVPGTQHHERPNWLRKMGLSTEAFTADDKVLAVLRALHQRRQTVPNVE